MTIATFRAEADAAERAFRTALATYHYADEWEFYRDRGEASPAVIVAHTAWTRALHRFYLARDGEHGVLGGRGL